MSSGEARLAVDCGSVTTAAVVVWPDGRWQTLWFDDGPVLRSAVFVSSSGRMVCGLQAWQAAARSRDGLFVPAPSRRLRDDAISGNGGPVTGVDVMAEPLRRVAEAAEQVAGGAIDDVRLVVPATWGPQRSLRLRQAAHRAGLPTARVVPAPVAAAELLVASGVAVPVGAHVAVCDLGGGVEAAVLHRGPDGFDVISVLDDPDAGGLRLDDEMAASLNGLTAPAAGAAVDPGWWQLVAATRIAKEELLVQPAVTVDMPAPLLPVVLTAAAVQAHAWPLWERAGQLTAAAAQAAGLQPADLADVFLAGGGAVMPQAAEVVGAALGRPVRVVPDPGIAAARGAVGAVGDPAGPGTVFPVLSRLPELPLRRLLGVLVPAVGSAGLFVEFCSVKARHPDLFPRPITDYYQSTFGVVMNWGQLGMACVLALVACLCGAAVLGSVLPANAGLHGRAASDAVRMGGGLVVAAVLGSFIAALYGVGAAIWLGDVATGSFLRWALGCTLPLAVIAVFTGVLAASRGRTPTVGWQNWLRFPILSAIPAAGGMLLLSVAHGYMVAGTGPMTSVERLGGFLIGVGTGLALVRPLLYRLIVVPPFAAVATAIVDVDSTGILAAFYVAAVTCWWLQRLWQLRFHSEPWTSDA